MIQDTINLNDSKLCEGFGCSEQSTCKVDVKVGTKGIIRLDLCEYCVKKFHDISEVVKNDF